MVSPAFAAAPAPFVRSVTTSLVGALPPIFGIFGCSCAFVGLAAAHGSGGGVLADGVGAGVVPALALFLSEPPERFNASSTIPTITATVPSTAPRMVLRRRCLARRS